MVRDRGRPFSRKHRSTWLAVTGGMILIGATNLVLGFLVWPEAARHPKKPEPILYDVPSLYTPDAAVGDAAPLLLLPGEGTPRTLEEGGFGAPARPHGDTADASPDP